MSHKSLSRYGYILKKDSLAKDEISQIKKELTAKPLVLPIFKALGLVDTSPYPIYIESPQRLFVPRFYGVQKFGQPTLDTISPGQPIDIIDNIKLMKHQLNAFNILINHLNSHGGGVLTLPCGFGKTVIGLKAIATLKKKAIVVVNKEFLMDQWIERIEQFLPNAKIGIIQQDKVEIEGNDIILAMLHSLSKKEYPKETFNDIGFVIFDECHHLAAEMFSKSLPKVASKYMLGLSATPNRRDGLSYVFYHYLGPLFHQEKRTGSNVVTVKQIKLTSNSPHYDTKYNNFRGKQMKNTKGMVGELCLFQERNDMVMQIIETLIKQERTILVLSERREHLESLMSAMNTASFRTPQNRFVTYGLYYGNQGGNKKKHKKMLEETSKCDVVFGTCAMASEALDIHTLNTLILLTPMTDVEQASGRILRKYHEKVNPLIVDLIDKCGNFVKHGKMREDYFRDEGYIIESYSTTLNGGTKNNWTPLISYLDSKNPIPNLIQSILDDAHDAKLQESVHENEPLVPKSCLLGEEDSENIIEIAVKDKFSIPNNTSVPGSKLPIKTTIKKKVVTTPKKKMDSPLGESTVANAQTNANIGLKNTETLLPEPIKKKIITPKKKTLIEA